MTGVHETALLPSVPRTRRRRIVLRRRASAMAMYALVPVIAALIAGSHPSVKAATSGPTAPVTSNDGQLPDHVLLEDKISALHSPVKILVLPPSHTSPDTLSIELSSNASVWIIDAELNDVSFASNFRRHHFSPDGEQVILISDDPRHFPQPCHYHGYVRGENNATTWAAVSTCNGIRVTFYDGAELLSVQPNVTDSSTYTIVKERELVGVRDPMSCGVSESAITGKSFDIVIKSINDKAPEASPVHHIVKRTITYTYFIELFVVVDKRAFDIIGNVSTVTTNVMDLVNIMDMLYKSLETRVALVNLLIWNTGDPITYASTDSSVILNGFQNYWSSNGFLSNASLHADHIMLYSGFDFDGTVVGLAYLSRVCTSNQVSIVQRLTSGYTDQIAAFIMTHELGHNLGMSHDDGRACDNCTTGSTCIMNTAVGPTSIGQWTACSVTDRNTLVATSGVHCLRNSPTQLFSAPSCGNGFLESGESCDCGTAQECGAESAFCSNCQFTNGAACLNDDPCCENNQIVRRADLMCRNITSQCDVAEYCDGQNSVCPADVAARNGWPCENNQAYCWDGVCQTFFSQCQRIWGTDCPGGSVRECFTNVNTMGTEFGNCGLNFATGAYTACAAGNTVCGNNMCLVDGDNAPIVSGSFNSTAKLATFTLTFQDGSLHRCRALSLFSQSNSDNPSLVADGSRCDPSGVNQDLICHSQTCVDKSTITTPCPLAANNMECNGTGVCTSAGSCAYTPAPSPPSTTAPTTVPNLVAVENVTQAPSCPALYNTSIPLEQRWELLYTCWTGFFAHWTDLRAAFTACANGYTSDASALKNCRCQYINTTALAAAPTTTTTTTAP
ncbi:zinc metalloproteinase-disintegrin-like MTP8 [Sycon ciliatum]|uniref:zinc metalloproteinase-disintegrin-like MTP8 n=1 Tax=Sycon ciliatum TaxID=27933 RepID=UPI0031F6794A